MENERYIQYDEGATFIPKCSICQRYVKADEEVKVHDHYGLSEEANATCKVHGRVQMMFVGFI